jgi:hypothetical protein
MITATAAILDVYYLPNTSHTFYFKFLSGEAEKPSLLAKCRCFCVCVLCVCFVCVFCVCVCVFCVSVSVKCWQSS